MVGDELDGEKILVDTSFLENVDDRVMRFLRFGGRATYPHFPITDGSALTLASSLKLQEQLLKRMPGLVKSSLAGLFSHDFRLRVRRMLGGSALKYNELPAKEPGPRA